MTAPLDRDWIAANQAYLTGELGRIHALLATRLGSEVPAAPDLAPLRAKLARPAAIDRLAAVFALDPFARDLVLLLAGAELDGRIARQIAALNGGSGRTLPTVATLFQALPEAHWSAFGPAGPLRHYRLVELDGDGRFIDRQLRLDERILHFLVGAPALDSRLAPLLRPIASSRPLAGSRAALVPDLAAALAAGQHLAIIGRDAEALGDLAGAALARAGRPAARIDIADLPLGPAERDQIGGLWQREALLTQAVLVITAMAAEEPALRSLGSMLDRLEAPALLLARDPPPPGIRLDRRLDLPALSADERLALWTEAIGAQAIPAPRLAGLVAHFNLPTSGIRAAAARLAAAGPVSPAKAADLLWAAARAEARPRLDDLAERIETRAGWDDLVLPAPQVATLREMTGQLAERLKVYERWGFRDRLSARGLGLAALFAGASGTGKTLAAEVIANALALDLYRIDLSAVVSKYIGETEKNLRRIFDSAEAGGAILLFDEADALFGRRSEVKDSHDRYANIEVSYLLQRMESYAGLAILTSNLKSHLDPAFLRRLRFVVDFPFPGPDERARIWQHIFPKAVPREDLDLARLAQLNVPGGAIRNIALNAAFLAAAGRCKLGMAHVLRAAESEYAKLERPLTDTELRGWVARANGAGGGRPR